MNDAHDESSPQPDAAGVRTLDSLERDLARHARAEHEPPADTAGSPCSTPAPPFARRREAEVELVRVHRLEQAALLRGAVELAGATRFTLWPFSAPHARPAGLAAWRKACDEELYFARLDGAPVPEELCRLRVSDPADWGVLANLARRALALENSHRNRLLLARAYVLDGELERARDLLRALLERSASPRRRARLYTTLGCVYEGLGEAEEALRAHERALALGAGATSAVACLLWGLACGDRPRALFAVEHLERGSGRGRRTGIGLRRAIRGARLRHQLVRGVPPVAAAELIPLTLECVCDGAPALAQATYELFA